MRLLPPVPCLWFSSPSYWFLGWCFISIICNVKNTEEYVIISLNFWIPWDTPGEKFSISSVQSLSRVRLLATTWIAACQASLFITNSRSPPKPMSIQSVMPSSHLILCHPLLLLPPILPSNRVFSNESTLHMRWTKFSIVAPTLVNSGIFIVLCLLLSLCDSLILL